MKFRVELDIPTHVPAPAMFVFGIVWCDDGAAVGEFRVGRLSMREDVAREFAELVNGEPWPPREEAPEDASSLEER